MSSRIEFYEALRAHMPEEAAKLIAERSPEPQDLATKADLQELRADIRGWMLAFFVPLWIGVYGTLGAVVISLVLRG